MGKIQYQEGGLLNRDNSIWKFLIRQLMYVGAGAGLYFFLSWLSFPLSLPGFRNVTFRPASVILVLFGLLYGPWVGFLSGIIGKTLADLIAGWGFYWNGSLAYGLIGFVPGLMKVLFKDFRLTKNIVQAVLWGALGAFLGAIFLSASAAYIGDIDFAFAFGAFFWPEFAGNLIIVIILLPLLILAISVIDQKWKK